MQIRVTILLEFKSLDFKFDLDLTHDHTYLLPSLHSSLYIVNIWLWCDLLMSVDQQLLLPGVGAGVARELIDFHNTGHGETDFIISETHKSCHYITDCGGELSAAGSTLLDDGMNSNVWSCGKVLSATSATAATR